jgi:hypothetical protein
MEVLVARWRTGEECWSFPSSHRRIIARLEARGWVWSGSSPAPGTIRVFLTVDGLRVWGVDEPPGHPRGTANQDVGPKVCRDWESMAWAALRYTRTTLESLAGLLGVSTTTAAGGEDVAANWVLVDRVEGAVRDLTGHPLHSVEVLAAVRGVLGERFTFWNPTTVTPAHWEKTFDADELLTVEVADWVLAGRDGAPDGR